MFGWKWIKSKRNKNSMKFTKFFKNEHGTWRWMKRGIWVEHWVESLPLGFDSGLISGSGDQAPYWVPRSAQSLLMFLYPSPYAFLPPVSLSLSVFLSQINKINLKKRWLQNHSMVNTHTHLKKKIIFFYQIVLFTKLVFLLNFKN